MKNLIFILFTVFSLGTKAQDSHESIQDNGKSIVDRINWESNYETAKKIAKRENKVLLVFFTGSDWCGPCKMLVEDFFSSEKFNGIAEKEFVLYEADFPRNRDLVSKSQKEDNYKLSNKYGVNSYPTIVVTDVNGKLLGKKKGYNFMREPSYHYDFLDEILKNK